MPAVIIIAVVLIGLVISCIKVVPHTESYVVERLGKFHAIWEAGLHFLAPHKVKFH